MTSVESCAGTVLPGGTANQGRIIRRGATLYRPRQPGATARQALLDHLSGYPFPEVPRVVRLEPDYEVLTFIAGHTASPRLHDWCGTDDTLRSVGALLRAYHDATRCFPADRWDWLGRVPPAYRGDVVVHNDPHPGNIVFRNGQAVGLIDFDLAEPGCRSWDLASAACFWVPLVDPADTRPDLAARQSQRLRVLLDGYDADETLRRAVVTALLPAHDAIYTVIRCGAEAGHPGFARSWRLRRRTAERARRWIEGQQQLLLLAVGLAP